MAYPEVNPDVPVVAPNAPITTDFSFTVPEKLLSNVCVCSAHHTDSHLSLPPSFGDHTAAPLDDGAPTRTKVEYKIVAKAYRKEDQNSQNSNLLLIGHTFRTIRVVPTATWLSEAQQSLVTSDIAPPQYTEQMIEAPSKTLRKGLFKSLGTLNVSVSSGKHIFVAASSPGLVPAQKASQPINNVRFNIRYHSKQASNPQLPILSQISAKICRSTRWRTRTYMPSTKEYTSSSQLLSSMRPNSDMLRWTEGTSHTYTSTVTIPFSLSQALNNRELLVPSFQTCLISHEHRLEIKLGFEMKDMSGTLSTVSVAVPIQVAIVPLAPGKALDRMLTFQNGSSRIDRSSPDCDQDENTGLRESNDEANGALAASEERDEDETGGDDLCDSQRTQQERTRRKRLRSRAGRDQPQPVILKQKIEDGNNTVITLFKRIL